MTRCQFASPDLPAVVLGNLLVGGDGLDRPLARSGRRCRRVAAHTSRHGADCSRHSISSGLFGAPGKPAHCCHTDYSWQHGRRPWYSAATRVFAGRRPAVAVPVTGLRRRAWRRSCLRVWSAGPGHDGYVAVVTEPGIGVSVTNAIADIAAVLAAQLSAPVALIEHWPVDQAPAPGLPNTGPDEELLVAVAGGRGHRHHPGAARDDVAVGVRDGGPDRGRAAAPHLDSAAGEREIHTW